MAPIELLPTSNVSMATPQPSRRSRTQWLPWTIIACAALYITHTSYRHPECISAPFPAGLPGDYTWLSDSTSSASNSQRATTVSSRFPPWSSFDNLFTFGDSYTSTGFDVNGEQPRLEHPMGNSDLGEGPISRNWPYFMTSRHNASLLKTYNFAAGGSTVDSSLVAPYILGSTFMDEARVFVQNYASAPRKAQWNPSTSLFGVWFGINDLILPRFRGEVAPSIPAIFASYHETVIKLYNAGARNFVFLTVPPAYRSIDLNATSLLAVAEDIASFNSRLFEMKSNLASAFPQGRFAAFDAHSFWARVIENPMDFEETKGIKDAEGVCDDVVGEDGLRRQSESTMCADGKPLREHIWTVLHGTYSIHNATSARLVRDCFGPEGKQGFCF